MRFSPLNKGSKSSYLPTRSAPARRLTIDKESSGFEVVVVDDRLSSSKFTIRRQVHPPKLFYSHLESKAMTIGVDVSKDTLVCCARDGNPFSVANSVQGVKRLLSKLAAGTILAMEATGRYHRLLADTAHSKGFVVFVFNPKDVNRYATSISPRAATDPIAARIIAEFASVRDHRPYVPPPAFVEVLRNLTRRGPEPGSSSSASRLKTRPASTPASRPTSPRLSSASASPSRSSRNR